MFLSPFLLAVRRSISLTTKSTTGELPIVQKTYDLIKWYVPILNRLPRDHKFGLGDRMIAVLYELLEGFVTARYASNKLAVLQPLSGKLDILQYHTRLLLDFQLVEVQRYEYASSLLNELGRQLTGWLGQQRNQK
jgi:23S rRNA-intervening sequence protein